MQRASFRPAGRFDPALLADIRAQAMRPSLEAVGRFDPDRARDRLLSAYAAEDTVLAYLGDALAGFYVLRPRADHLYLDHLYVLAAHQGAGLGRQMVARVQDRARAARLPVQLTALRGSPANGFYQSCGFELTGSDALDNRYEWRASARGEAQP
ncbi:Histone acetyltransferase HPA2 [Candidatus Rhodobacter oscarellae]|uniref:Histone acetyltransferase HPA2 n=1 Tax=Candidatus Rhodobacter oscarellae TaxID=1675527 RepID=A0A0J9GWU1_9RHOB|nr:GNAT family N-acetyltransferase [Candidatus Rhodobacter lobularis]KMW58003.1 Histone acetyltransferase HPA2 [Candidatus Rhodobacter lobularis]